MGYDDKDDDWPEPERDPEKLAHAREVFAQSAALRQRIIRYTFMVVGVLALLVVILALTR
jgi:hypothetical protein